MSAAIRPRRRLRTRLSFFLFALSAVPALVITGIAYRELDELLESEIARRRVEVVAATERALSDARESAEQAVSAFAESEELRRQLLDTAQGEGAFATLGLLERFAHASRLDLLAIVEVPAIGEPIIAASVHSPASMEKTAPRFVRTASAGETRVGFAHDLAAGNPPAWVPAIVAARALVGEDGRTAYVVYGGVRLDTHRLEAVATHAHARLVLDSPNLGRMVFPRGAEALAEEPADGALELPSLPDGRARPAWATSAAEELEEPKTPTALSIRADTARLEAARSTFTALAAALAGTSLLLALVAGAWLARPITRPILELASAAERVGAGDLSVEVPVRTEDEVGALVVVFNQMTKELAEARGRLQRAERIAAWREVARRVAHEIKNPLSPIQMAVETIAKSYKNRHPALDEIVEESTRAVLEEVRALNRIVTEFSELARLPAPRRAPVTPLELLAHAHALHAAGGRVHLDSAGVAQRALPELHADRDQLGQVLTNLVKNGLEALPPEAGQVRLDARAEVRGGRAGVELIVRDDGAGMTEAVRAQIFAPYFTTKPKGSGLGLAIVERIVLEHQGVIDVDSAPGVGTTFRVWLPASNEPRPSGGR